MCGIKYWAAFLLLVIFCTAGWIQDAAADEICEPPGAPCINVNMTAFLKVTYKSDNGLDKSVSNDITVNMDLCENMTCGENEQTAKLGFVEEIYDKDPWNVQFHFLKYKDDDVEYAKCTWLKLEYNVSILSDATTQTDLVTLTKNWTETGMFDVPMGYSFKSTDKNEIQFDEGTSLEISYIQIQAFMNGSSEFSQVYMADPPNSDLVPIVSGVVVFGVVIAVIVVYFIQRRKQEKGANAD